METCLEQVAGKWGRLKLFNWLSKGQLPQYLGYYTNELQYIAGIHGNPLKKGSLSENAMKKDEGELIQGDLETSADQAEFRKYSHDH